MSPSVPALPQPEKGAQTKAPMGRRALHTRPTPIHHEYSGAGRINMETAFVAISRRRSLRRYYFSDRDLLAVPPVT
ncbi:hypothetical protein EVAR_31823_1 [Eumeta japonica]|uniref:Uncharacterized protein n=1 Tax=Eumeta variegata TaxID=151549 RepID=A0A4C1WLC0_EUMVA|nr:hypothetical protein EVAR_31823_1 [Eumeta japonica]